MAFLFDDSGSSAVSAHRSLTRVVPLLLVALGLVLVLLFRTGLDLLLWAVGILATAFVARGVSSWFADHLGAKGELAVMLVLLAGFWATMTWIEPARKAAMSPFYKVLAFGQSQGYGGVWAAAPVSAGSPSAGGTPSSRSGSGAGARPGGSAPASSPVATGDGRRSLLGREIPTSTLLRVSAPSVGVGTPVTITAEVRAAEGIPDGRVRFVFNGTASRRATLGRSGGAGAASLTLDSLKVGVYDIAAEYAGAGQFRASTALPVRVVVRPAH